MNRTPLRQPQICGIRRCRFASWTTLVALFAATPGAAAVFSVGPGGNCTHTNLQAALDTAANSPGADTVRIVRTATWNAIQVSTQTDQDVEIVGGWQACDSPAPSGKTILSGAGGQARSVIALRGNGVFRLRHLVIRDGDQAGDDDGGGIHFQGGGIVEISDSEIVENSAEDGGGIYAQGTTTLAELIIGANVIVANNTARRNGGGVVAQNIEMSMTAPGSVLMMNTAAQRGGGLLVASGSFTSHAYIGSSGLGDTGPVYSNQAAIGGGIAVVGGSNSARIAQVQVFGTAAGTPTRIRGNVASQRGGGIDLQPDGDAGDGNARAIAQLRHVVIEENSAPVGPAINLSYDSYGIGGNQAIGGEVFFNMTIPDYIPPAIPLHPAALPCPIGAPCGYIRNNSTGNITGAVVQLSENARLFGSRIAIENNEGGWLMYLSGEEETQLQLDNSLIAGNVVQNALIRDDQNQDSTSSLLRLHYLTIAGNTIGANGVLSVNEDMTFQRSLVDQPGKRMFATDVGVTGGVRNIVYVVDNTTAYENGLIYGAPRFVDADNGDYLPRAGARAVDLAPPISVFNLDLHSHQRPIDLPFNPNEGGTVDAGALERQSLLPMVLNSSFDADLNHWTGLGPESSWDGSQNATGPAGSGSVRVVYNTDPKPGITAARLAGRAQCIHLPGPGSYQLNGWGRVVPSSNPPLTSNRARLTWELRYNGSMFGCEDGAPDLAGTHVLASTATWARPAAGAVIQVPAAVWTHNTSLTVKLDVIGGPLNPPTAWFDGITLDPGTPDTDRIFANGFEP